VGVGDILFIADSDRNGGGVKPKAKGERLELGSSETAGGPDMSAGMGKMVDNCGD